jgi:hypothetical protein
MARSERHDPEEFVRRVNEAIKAEAWVVDGNYGPVRDRVWQRATHLVWLDYERPVIMARVVSRTFFRAVLRTAALGRQPRALAAYIAAQPPDPLGLEYLGAPPPRNRRPPGAEQMRTSGGIAAAPPKRSIAGSRVPSEGGWRINEA